MSGNTRMVLRSIVVLVLLALTGCGGAFVNNETTAVSTETVSTQLQFVDGSEVGPLYNVQVEVPTDWVGQFEIRNQGNKIYFDYVTDSGGSAKVFFIEALSSSQYWQQSGSHPGSYVNIINRGNTYFIYYLPIDAYHSGLSDEQFLSLAEAVPQIVASFNARVAN